MKNKNKKPNKKGDKLIDLDKFIPHIIGNQKKYLFSLLTIILILPLISNFIQNKPLLMRGESYYFLEKFGLISFFSESLIALIPLLLAVLSISILLKLGKKFKLSEKFTFLFVFLLILSPAFILAYTSLSFYPLIFLLVLLGFLLLHHKQEWIRFLSFIPFAAVTFIDTFSTILLLALLLIYFLVKMKNIKDLFNTKYLSNLYQNRISLVIVGATFLLLLLNKIIFKIPFFIGPFHVEQRIVDFVSDLGGLSGVSFFIFLLALIGLTTTWKKKNFYFAYLLLPIIILGYVFNTDAIFYLSLITILFAAIGFTKLFERHWTLSSLKKVTFFLLILGIIFSSLTYLDRISDYPPLNSDEEVLIWIKENTSKNAIVASFPENSYFIKYFAEREPFYTLNKDSKTKKELNDQIFSSTYIKELFPILDENDISLIFISKDMKEKLPKEQGFLFLLKNERFKLIHSSQDSEVWVYKEDEPDST